MFVGNAKNESALNITLEKHNNGAGFSISKVFSVISPLLQISRYEYKPILRYGAGGHGLKGEGWNFGSTRGCQASRGAEVKTFKLLP